MTAVLLRNLLLYDYLEEPFRTEKALLCLTPEMTTWVIENTKGGWRIECGEPRAPNEHFANYSWVAVSIVYEDETDAVLHLLRWGGEIFSI